MNILIEQAESSEFFLGEGKWTKADLKKALQLYTTLQPPENVKLYLATLDPKKIAAGDYSPTDLQVDVGIAFTNFELGNWDKAQEGLGALIGTVFDLHVVIDYFR